VLLVGGTFDPPHLAHASMAEIGRLWLDGRDPNQAGTRRHLRVLADSALAARADAGIGSATLIAFVPAARSPFKPPPIADDAARVEMVRAMASDIPGSIVWTDEIDRARPAQPSYWIDTLERARAAAALGGANPSASPDLCFLIGADQAISLHRWRDARRLLELARPVIVLRSPMNTPEMLGSALHQSHFWCDEEAAYLLSRVAPAMLSDVSATAVRTALGSQEPDASSSLSPAVLHVIHTRGLYRTQ